MVKDRLENYINTINKRYRLLADISKLERTKADYSPSLLNSGVGSIRGSGMSSPTENTAINNLTFFEEINSDIAQKQAELAAVDEELKLLDNYIEAIPDEQLKEIFKLRYTQAVSWANIAVKWFYAPSSWIHIQKRVYDYINQHELL